MIRSSILNTKVTKEALVEDEYQKNESAMNTQSENEIDMDYALAKYKYNKPPSEATSETKKRVK